MQRFLPAILPVVMLPFAAAQHVPVINPSRGVAAPVNAYPYGNILYPGGVPTHPGALGRTVAGYSYTGVGPGPMRRGVYSHPGRGAQTVVVPYAVPIYMDPYAYGMGMPQQAPPITVVVPQQPAPSVIINHNYSPETAKPVLRDYSNADLPEPSSSSSGLKVYEGSRSSRTAETPATTKPDPDDKPALYLIALKDSTVRTAIGYWIVDGTLSYVTPQGTVNRITIDQVDRETTERLNAERKQSIHLAR